MDEIKIKGLIKILDSTIKEDDASKVITFLTMLATFTEQDQMNISFNAPSSTGKTYIASEVSKYFPKEDIIRLAYCSPTAFFHEQGKYIKETNTMTIDLSRKIIIFQDMPNNLLLERLRPLLSHDSKIITSKITDKNETGGHRAKTIQIIGFPSVIFCSANYNIDEQEASRCILLSPDYSENKFRKAIHEKVERESNPHLYKVLNATDKDRTNLIERIQLIKDMAINQIILNNPELIEDTFLSLYGKLMPQHSRDIGKIISISKSIALLNAELRNLHNNTITTTETDIIQSFELWKAIEKSQSRCIPPHIYQIYETCILTPYQNKRMGLSSIDINKAHLEQFNKVIPEYRLRKEIYPLLEAAGLIVIEKNPTDSREKVILPIIQETDTPVDELPTSDVLSGLSTGNPS